MNKATENMDIIKNHVNVDTEEFFSLQKPERIQRNLNIELTERSYLPKAKAPRSDWVASVAYPAFLAIQQMDIGLSKFERFATIGTGTGLDALAAIEVFDCHEVVVTDMHEDVTQKAKQNILANLRQDIPPIKIHALTGDLLSPLRQIPEKFDLIYENLPNIPFHKEDDLKSKQTSSSYIGNREEKVPEFVKTNLLNLHYLALLQAKDSLTEKGAILSSIGARISLNNMLKLSSEAGLEGSFLNLTWKVQSEPEEVIGGYAAWQKQGLGPFHFYPADILEETFEKMDMVAAGAQALEIEHALLPYQLDAISAYQAYLEGKKVGHTVAVLMSRLKG